MSLQDKFTESVKLAAPSLDSKVIKWDRELVKTTLDKAGDEDTKIKHDLLAQLLREVVRPAFSKHRSKDVTAQGRRAMESWQPTVPYDSDAIRAAKPWRYEDPWVVEVFEWCLEHLDESSIEENWPMVVPPIFAHLDDDSNASKVKGCTLLQKLLKITPTKLLTKTGLGDVFEQALLPNLIHIPPAFEQAEALSLLDATYPALLLLVRVRFPETDRYIESKQKALDRIVRQGIFSGLDSLKEEVAVNRLLLRQMDPFLDELGILSVKHLKTMVPLVSTRLTSPFSTAAPGLMHDAASAMRAILLNCWPRVPGWRLEIIEALTIPYIRILEEDSSTEELQAVQAEIVDIITTLRDILARCDDGEAYPQVKRILESDERVSKLLDIWDEQAGAQVPE